jgi:hypothetical protein
VTALQSLMTCPHSERPGQGRIIRRRVPRKGCSPAVNNREHSAHSVVPHVGRMPSYFMLGQVRVRKGLQTELHKRDTGLLNPQLGEQRPGFIDDNERLDPTTGSRRRSSQMCLQPGGGAGHQDSQRG